MKRTMSSSDASSDDCLLNTNHPFKRFAACFRANDADSPVHTLLHLVPVINADELSFQRVFASAASSCGSPSSTTGTRPLPPVSPPPGPRLTVNRTMTLQLWQLLVPAPSHRDEAFQIILTLMRQAQLLMDKARAELAASTPCDRIGLQRAADNLKQSFMMFGAADAQMVCSLLEHMACVGRTDASAARLLPEVPLLISDGQCRRMIACILERLELVVNLTISDITLILREFLDSDAFKNQTKTTGKPSSSSSA